MLVQEGKSYIMRNGDTTGPMEKLETPFALQWRFRNPDSNYDYLEDGMYVGAGIKHPFDLIALNESDPDESHEATREDIKQQIADAFRPPTPEMKKGCLADLPETELPNVGMVTVSASEYIEMQNLIKLQKHKIDSLTQRIEFIKKHLS